MTQKPISQLIWQKISKAKRILLISHRNPDADTIGSNLAFRKLLLEKAKEVVSLCTDPIPDRLKFLFESNPFVQKCNLDKFDLIIAFDTSSLAQIGFSTKKQILKNKEFINIDHHASNNFFGTINLVDKFLGSTTMILYALFKTWGIPIDKPTALCLLAGIYFDTGSFRHANTTDLIMETAAELMSLGADINLISQNLFRKNRIEQLKLLGKILESAEKTADGVVISAIPQNDMKKFNTTNDDLSGIIEYLTHIRESRLTVLLSEDDKGQVKGSLRTQSEDINTYDISAQFNGGGHQKASGFTIQGKLKKEIHWTIKPGKQ